MKVHNEPVELEGELLENSRGTRQFFRSDVGMFKVTEQHPSGYAGPELMGEKDNLSVVRETSYELFYTRYAYIFPVKETTRPESQTAYLIGDNNLIWLGESRFTTPWKVGADASDDEGLMELYTDFPRKAEEKNLVRNHTLIEQMEEQGASKVNVIASF